MSVVFATLHVTKAEGVYTPARFIALEGIDGSGTTTQAKLLADRLRSLGHTVVQTAEPSQGIVGRSCRAALQDTPPLVGDALALMFAADRLDHLATVVEPALAAGHVVVCDRYLLSTLAYQGETLPHPWLCAINARSRPADVSVVFELPTAVAQVRIHDRGGITERFDAAPLQQRIATRYSTLAASAPPEVGPILRLDARGSTDVVAHRLWAQLEALVGPPAGVPSGLL